MLTLHIESHSIEDLCMKARGFIGAHGMPTGAMVEAPAVEKPAEAKKAGRPKGTVVQSAPVETSPTPAAAPAPVVNPFDDAPETVPTKTATLEDVRSALQEVAVKYPGEPGMDKVKAILAKFDTFKVSAVKPEKYQAVIDECKKA